MMPRNNQVCALAQFRASFRHYLSRFNFHVDRPRTVLNRQIENLELILHAAVVFTVILMPPARGQNRTCGIIGEELSDGLRAQSGVGEIIEPELKEIFAGFSLPTGLFEKPGNVRQSKRDTDPGERAPLRHLVH
jgi:hypothetical protein